MDVVNVINEAFLFKFSEGDVGDWLALRHLVLFVLRSFVFGQSRQIKARIVSA